MKNSVSGVTRTTANGTRLQPGQSLSPMASARRNASASRMRSSNGIAGFGGTEAASRTGISRTRTVVSMRTSGDTRPRQGSFST